MQPPLSIQYEAKMTNQLINLECDIMNSICGQLSKAKIALNNIFTYLTYEE